MNSKDSCSIFNFQPVTTLNKHLHRRGKDIQKFNIQISFHSIWIILNRNFNWYPKSLGIHISHGDRSFYTKRMEWNPSFNDKYESKIYYPDGESLNFCFTIFSHNNEKEPKIWTVYLLKDYDQSNTKIGPLAYFQLDLSSFAFEHPIISKLTVKMKPIYPEIQSVELSLSLFTVKIWSKSSGVKNFQDFYISENKAFVKNKQRKYLFEEYAASSSDDDRALLTPPIEITPAPTLLHEKKREQTIQWLRGVLRNFKDLHIENLTSSFADGKIFLALLSIISPDKCDFEKRNTKNFTKEENLNFALELFSRLNIPGLFVPHDFEKDTALNKPKDKYMLEFLNNQIKPLIDKITDELEALEIENEASFPSSSSFIEGFPTKKFSKDHETSSLELLKDFSQAKDSGQIKVMAPITQASTESMIFLDTKFVNSLRKVAQFGQPRKSIKRKLENLNKEELQRAIEFPPEFSKMENIDISEIPEVNAAEKPNKIENTPKNEILNENIDIPEIPEVNAAEKPNKIENTPRNAILNENIYIPEIPEVNAAEKPNKIENTPKNEILNENIDKLTNFSIMKKSLFSETKKETPTKLNFNTFKFYQKLEDDPYYDPFDEVNFSSRNISRDQSYEELVTKSSNNVSSQVDLLEEKRNVIKEFCQRRKQAYDRFMNMKRFFNFLPEEERNLAERRKVDTFLEPIYTPDHRKIAEEYLERSSIQHLIKNYYEQMDALNELGKKLELEHLLIILKEDELNLQRIVDQKDNISIQFKDLIICIESMEDNVNEIEKICYNIPGLKIEYDPDIAITQIDAELVVLLSKSNKTATEHVREQYLINERQRFVDMKNRNLEAGYQNKLSREYHDGNSNISYVGNRVSSILNSAYNGVKKITKFDD